MNRTVWILTSLTMTKITCRRSPYGLVKSCVVTTIHPKTATKSSNRSPPFTTTAPPPPLARWSHSTKPKRHSISLPAAPLTVTTTTTTLVCHHSTKPKHHNINLPAKPWTVPSTLLCPQPHTTVRFNVQTDW